MSDFIILLKMLFGIAITVIFVFCLCYGVFTVNYFSRIDLCKKYGGTATRTWDGDIVCTGAKPKVL